MMPYYLTRAAVLALCLSATSAFSAIWQWSVPVKNEKPQNGPARAWLWVPPNCAKIRGVVLAQHNMEEISILENPKFRAALTDLNYAEVWVAPFFDHLFRFNEGAGETFNDMMSRLAETSGYSELNFVPVVPIGHSAAASWPYYFAAWKPERTLAAISTSGQWPYFRNKDFAPDIWGMRNVNFVPCLETMGEYESANDWSREGLHEREGHPLMPLSMLACPGEGHFAASDKKVEYLALYIKKAIEARVPRDWDGNSAPQLIPVDPTQTGWLADKWRLNQKPTAMAAPVDKYRGNKAEAFWFFDGEMARATEKYEAEYRGAKPQLVGFVQDGSMALQHDSHLQVDLKFEPESDGVTFKLTGAFYPRVPGGSPRPAGWTGLPVDAVLGHATGEQPISIERICGPFEKLADDTFALRLQKENTPMESRYELVFAAKHPGNYSYKAAVQQAHMYVPARNTAGAFQTITFPQIPDQKAGTESVKLNATSSAGEKVYYYVREGPAEIDGEVLKFDPVPPHAKFPVKVTVVAWQYGRSIEPKLKTAEPVECAFNIVK